MKFVFVNGRVGVVVRYWDEPPRPEEGNVLEGGARVDIREVQQLEGPGHRAGAAGFTVMPVGGGGGIWRADLFISLASPGQPCFHYHPDFGDDDVGDRVFSDSLKDPRSWIAHQLRDLPGLLRRQGAEDLAASVDVAQHERALPLMLQAIDACLAQLPTKITNPSTQVWSEVGRQPTDSAAK